MWNPNTIVYSFLGGVGRSVTSPNQHLLREDDVISCCLDLSATCISFRVNGQPVQGMLENFSVDGLLFPVISFSAGVQWVTFEWILILYVVLLVGLFAHDSSHSEKCGLIPQFYFILF